MDDNTIQPLGHHKSIPSQKSGTKHIIHKTVIVTERICISLLYVLFTVYLTIRDRYKLDSHLYLNSLCSKYKNV